VVGLGDNEDVARPIGRDVDPSAVAQAVIENVSASCGTDTFAQDLRRRVAGGIVNTGPLRPRSGLVPNAFSTNWGKTTGSSSPGRRRPRPSISN
jgi:hypothetical protein